MTPTGAAAHRPAAVIEDPICYRRLLQQADAPTRSRAIPRCCDHPLRAIADRPIGLPAVDIISSCATVDKSRAVSHFPFRSCSGPSRGDPPMQETGFTKARSNGALADAVEIRGGSITRVFARAELPLSLIDQPEMLVPLRDQIHLLEYASQEIGDDALSARLASEAGVPGLGVYGDRLLSAPQLEAAIARASLLIGALLQSSTSLRLDVDGPWARWTYDISTSTEVGRQKHDILALGYMLDLLRHFAGRRCKTCCPANSRAATRRRSSFLPSCWNCPASVRDCRMMPASSKSRRPCPTPATS